MRQLSLIAISQVVDAARSTFTMILHTPVLATSAIRSKKRPLKSAGVVDKPTLYKRMSHVASTGDARIRQSCNIFGGQAGIELDDGAVGRLQKGGHATINCVAWESRGSAVHIIARAAFASEAAGDLRMDDDRLPDRHVADRRSNLVHPASVLMAPRGMTLWLSGRYLR